MTPLGRHNSQIVRLRRLSGRRRARRGEGCFVVEGPLLVAEAAAAGLEIEVVYASEGAEVPDGVGPVVRTGPGVLEGALDTVSPQGVAAVVAIPRHDVEEVAVAARSALRPVVVLDGVADPGNAGTILRSAEASGAVAVVVTEGTVDTWSPKVVRSAAGASFRLPVVEATLGELEGLRRVGTSARAPVGHLEADLGGAVAIVVGNEAHGLDPDAPVDEWVRVEMDGPTESLNVAMAATVLLFEAVRQRRIGRT